MREMESELENLHMWISIKKQMIRVPEEYRSPYFIVFMEEIDGYIKELTAYLTS